MSDDRALLDELETFLPELARAAGDVHLSHYERLGAGDIDLKGRRDLLTIADRESEALIVDAIQKRYPEHAIFAEESGTSSNFDRAAKDRIVWYIDPLDGTTNFAHGHPMFATSLGVFRDGEPLAGCVHAARLGETFLAVRGRGAHLNGRRLRVSAADDLKSALLATGFPYKIESLDQNNIDNFSKLVPIARGIRRCGAAALDLAYVAAGRYDGFWELHLEPWDMAAGALLVREAGGRVTDFAGGDFWLFGRNIVATNGPLHEPLRRELRPFA